MTISIRRLNARSSGVSLERCGWNSLYEAAETRSGRTPVSTKR